MLMLFSADQGLGSNESRSPATPLIAHLWLFKGVIAGAALAGLVLTGLVLCFITPRYQAEAVVIVDSRRDKLADVESAVSGIVVDQYQTALKSEVALLTSPTLAQHVIKRLGLLQTADYQSAFSHTPTAAYFATGRQWLLDGLDPLLRLAGYASPVQSQSAGGDPTDAVMQSAVKIFEKHLEAINDPKSLTLRVRYQSTSPVLAAQVANAVADDYLNDDADLKRAASERSEAWLRARISDLRANLETAEHAVEDYRAKHELATVRDRDPLEEELLQLKKSQIDAQNQVAVAQAKVAQTADAKPESLAANEDVLNSRMVAGLLQLETQLQSQRAGMLATRQTNSRTLESISDQLTAVDAQLRTAINRFAKSNVGQLHVAEARLADLTMQITALQATITTANRADIKMRSLEQDVSAARSVLDDFTKRYNQDAGAPLALPDSRVVARAEVPVDPVSPHYALMLAGGMLGFAGTAFFASSLALRLRSGFTSSDELGTETGLVVAGLIPFVGMRARRRLASPTRELAVTIRALTHTALVGNPASVVLVTSTIPGEGKSTLALALARSIGRSSRRCLLIDADLRNPSLHTTLRVPGTPGLVDLTRDDGASTAASIRPMPDDGFDLLPAGRPTQDILSPFEDFSATLTRLKRDYDVIILDSAPLLLAAEGLVLSGHADLTLFLVKWRTTPRQIVRKASSLLTRCSTGKCLAVLSQVSDKHLRRGGASVEDQYRATYQLR
jgi:succinoglycan biosynthesis transport protein ExoP